MTRNRGAIVLHTFKPGDDINTIADDLTAPARGWAAVRHQLHLRRKLARVIAAFEENERMRRDAVDLIRAENRDLHRRALTAEGFIAYSGLETTYGVRDTFRRPTTPTHLSTPDHNTPPEETP